MVSLPQARIWPCLAWRPLAFSLPVPSLGGPVSTMLPCTPPHRSLLDCLLPTLAPLCHWRPALAAQPCNARPTPHPAHFAIHPPLPRHSFFSLCSAQLDSTGKCMPLDQPLAIQQVRSPAILLPAGALRRLQQRPAAPQARSSGVRVKRGCGGCGRCRAALCSSHTMGRTHLSCGTSSENEGRL